MPLERRSNSLRIIRRLMILLIATLVIKYALAASEFTILANETGEGSQLAAEESAPAKAKPQPNFVPSEAISAARSISFPTDI